MAKEITFNLRFNSFCADLQVRRNKFDDVFLDHGGLPHVLPLAVNLDFFLVGFLD